MGFMDGIIKMFRTGTEENKPAGLGRNDDCWCGSGRKYKKCHLEDDEKTLRSKCTLNCGKT